ncbi:MAG: SDR family NAD(P)-dependent oxidoreductase [Deltaproteobacteria bacterium]|nr:SDR family NAD(P)-dependent oxidoreductase [Deltaproteobacteria bacterium]
MSSRAREPVAIVGIGCRFPGASDVEAFWRLLIEGRSSIRPYRGLRFRELDEAYRTGLTTQGPLASLSGGFLDGVDRFDASFFGVAPREAALIDPQHRLLLETAWEALEDSGEGARAAGSDTGVFVGVWRSDYESRIFQSERGQDFYGLTGCARFSASGRISFSLDLRGPCISVETACSTSLVAAHLACRSLWAGECELALAGGANLILGTDATAAFTRAEMLSSDGLCKFGDAGANGFVRGEGAGVVALTTLSRALASRQKIYALIRGGATNNNGQAARFFVAPSEEAQARLLRAALADAGAEPNEVAFVEAHGTGTPAGDSAELGAIRSVLGGAERASPCLVGSAKTNFGHTESASGVAGLIKAALSLQRRVLPPSLNIESLAPYSRPGFGVELSTRARELAPATRPLLAGVSAFGMSGSNAHLVLEEPPRASRGGRAPFAMDRGARTDRPFVLSLSARSDAALRRLAHDHEKGLPFGAPSLGSLCYTACARRRHHPHRLAVAAAGEEGIADGLRAFLRGEQAPGLSWRRAGAGPRKVAFIFSGHGSQWAGMSLGLLDAEPVFRASMEQCDEAIRAEVGWSVIDWLGRKDAKGLDSVDVVQPALFSISVSLSRLLESFGVRPGAVLGHSLGEVTAAYCAGGLSLEDAAAVVCRRSRLMLRVADLGAMALVNLSAAECASYVSPGIEIGVINSPSSTVLTGDAEAIRALGPIFETKGVFFRVVKVNVASHSAHIDRIHDAMLDALDQVRPKRASIPFYSSVCPPDVSPELNREYWARTLRGTVRFGEAFTRLLDDGFDTFVEISPHPLLLTAIEENLRARRATALAVGTLKRDKDERLELATQLGALHCAGVAVDWERWFPNEVVVSLPPYPWERDRHWIDVPRSEKAASPTASDGRFALRAVASALPHESHLFELTRALPSYLEEHRFRGAVTVPASVHLELAREGTERALGTSGFDLVDFHLERAILLGDGDQTELRLAIFSGSDGQPEFRLSGRATVEGAVWETHSGGKVRRRGPSDRMRARDLDALRRGSPIRLDQAAHLAAARARGLELGPRFQVVREVFSPDPSRSNLDEPSRSESWIGRILDLRSGHERSAGSVHPILLDGAFQVALHALGSEDSDAYFPATLSRFSTWAEAPEGSEVWSVVHRRKLEPGREVECDVELLDGQGEVLAEARGLVLRRLARSAASLARESLFHVEWRALSTEHTPALRPAQAGAAGQWFILGGPGVLGERLVVQLEEVDPSVRWVVVRDLDELRRSAGGRVRGVVDLRPIHGSSFAGRLEDECMNAAGLSKLLEASASFSIWVVTQGAAEVGGSSGESGLHGRAAGALALVLGREHPEARVRTVDLGPDPSALDLRALAGAIARGDLEERTAIRGGIFFAPRLSWSAEPVREAAAKVRPDGTYLITGGLGVLGIETARWLARRGATSIALVGRRAPSAGANEAIEELEARGIRTLVRSCDVASHEEVASLVERLSREAAPLRGVVHAAGVMEPGLLVELTRGEALRVIAPKVMGAMNLEDATRGLSLDWMMLYSSIASEVPLPGQGAYAAASAFLDAFARSRRALGRPTLSVGWGVWRAGGMAELPSLERSKRVYFELGLRSITSEQAFASLEVALACGVAHAVVTPIDAGALAARRDAPLLLSALVPGVEGPVPERPPRALERGALEEWVRQELASVLQLPPARLHPEQPMGELGLDSLMALELVRRLGASLGVSLRATSVFNYPTLAAFAHYISERLAPDGPRRGEVPSRPLRTGTLGSPAELSDEEVVRALINGE